MFCCTSAQLCARVTDGVVQGMTVDEAIAHVTERKVWQPVLLCIDGQYFVKLDSTAMYIHEPSCFADCVEYLFKIFHVFNVHYAAELDLVFKLLESILSVSRTTSSRILSDFIISIS